ncbi:major facilitator superfamily domain-containing protein [Hypoxylon rubiginosum]|uniref:Major facilitator superfamily domain-containing protein n=1 Tax=Hypoxylon rubiginosum TaxID=110542 RepID=A0ACC0CL79_9PEZI|nr:major facilitator superfamily domain-containing protein [Hypoxylon rubiginosum]
MTLESSGAGVVTSEDYSEQQSSRQEFSLPPVDGGKAAWLFLAACWVVEALVWGFAYSFGVFQDYYSANEPFAGSGSIAAIGTTTSGIMYIGTPIVIILSRLYPRVARWFTIIGLTTTSVAIGLSSLCTTVPQLIVTQGLVAGIGGCLAYSPCTLYINEWFVKRKGLAYGLVWSAAGFGGCVLPLLLNVLLGAFGFKTTLRIWAGILFACSSPLAYFVRPRLPYSAATHMRPFDVRYFTSRAFTLHQIANIIQALGYFLPMVYLPSYARSVYDASGYLPALTLLLMNMAATIGSVIMGFFTDKLQSTTCILISTVGATVGVFFLWGLSTSLPILYCFCFAYGLFAGCWTSMWPAIMREVSNKFRETTDQEYFDPMMVFGWLCVGRGIGNVASGPISNLLIEGMPWKGQSIGGFGSGYGGLIVFTGVSAFFGGSTFVWKHLNLL